MKESRTRLLLWSGLLTIAIAACGTPAEVQEPEPVVTEPGAAPDTEVEQTTEAEVEELTTLRVGSLAHAGALAGVFVADELGYFADENLEVDITPLGGGAEGIAAVQGGSLDITHAPYVATLTARNEGFDFVVLVSNNSSPTEPPHEMGLLTLDSREDIQRPSDLEGMRIGVNNLESVRYMYTAYSIRQDGGDDTTIDWVEIGAETMIDALLQGQFDAVVATEPFTTVGLETGEIRLLAYPALDVYPGLDVGGYIAMREFAEENQEAIKRFVRANLRAHEWLTENPAEANQFIAESTGVELELVESGAPVVYPQETSVEGLRILSDIMVEFGAISEPQDPDEYLWPTALGEVD